MRTISLTVDNVMDALRQARDQRGADFRFSDKFGAGMGCFYHATADDEQAEDEGDDPTTPACHVGLALHIIDPALDEFTRAQNAEKIARLFGLDYTSPLIPDEGVTVPFGDLTITITNVALRALMAAQDVQDDGGTWGEGYDAAEYQLSFFA